ncbi:Yop proteins translocation protein L [Posidoniimonas polymericola]|uniref:Flagellar assembly protein FliH n=1 Tax=Posidoniimonas polymericola TaxID=2528002 RepID=A0A5C5YQY2_9BACT|nr:FliH/SctL family protein [Posidoniimonas polymericola]TWT77218.1 Yop proteins translocation protein L [Posidoniimonas polymericola]
MASIIRGGVDSAHATNNPVRAVAFDFHDMSHRAEEYIQEVRNEAAKIVQQAHSDAEQIRRKAEQAGRETAEQAIEKVLSEMVGKQIDTLRPAVNKIVHQLNATRDSWQEHWREAAVALAVKIAERLVRRELTARPEISAEWVAEALTMAAGGGDIAVRLNPADHAHLAPKADEIAQDLGKLAQTRIIADSAVSPGGCLVETRHGSIDLQLESQLERIAEELS